MISLATTLRVLGVAYQPPEVIAEHTAYPLSRSLYLGVTPKGVLTGDIFSVDAKGHIGSDRRIIGREAQTLGFGNASGFVARHAGNHITCIPTPRVKTPLIEEFLKFGPYGNFQDHMGALNLLTMARNNGYLPPNKANSASVSVTIALKARMPQWIREGVVQARVLLEKWAIHRDPVNRNHAVDVLSELLDLPWAKALIRELAKNNNDSIQKYAVKTLAQDPNRPDLDLLRQIILQNNLPAATLFYCARALILFGNPVQYAAGIQVLVQLTAGWHEDVDPSLKVQIAKLFAKLDDHQIKNKVDEYLRRFPLHDPYENRTIKLEDSRCRKLRILMRSQSYGVQNQIDVARLLAKYTNDPEALAFLKEKITDPAYANMATMALCDGGDKETYKMLENKINSDDAATRHDAISFLATIATKPALAILEKRAHNPGEYDLLYLIHALDLVSILNTERAESTLSHIAIKEHNAIAERAKRALRKMS